MAQKPRPISTDDLWRALVDAGVLHEDEKIRRIVIDAQAGELIVMYIERWGDERLLDVALTLNGVEIRGVPADGGIGDLAEQVQRELVARKRRQGIT